jgi:menaquinone-9 beta-reductase
VTDGLDRDISGAPGPASGTRVSVTTRTLQDLDAIIIGGGPAGSAAAIELARAGRSVVIIERMIAAHDKVCGDFLSTEAITSLDSLGLNLASLGAVQINHIRLATPLGLSSAQLPFAAQSITRRALDEALLGRAADAGALLLRGHTAESLHRTGNLWRVSVTGPSHTHALTAPHLLLATGKHDLRGLPRPEGPHPDLVGLKMYLRLAPAQIDALRDTIELFLLRGGYGGLSLVETSSDSSTGMNAANLCFVINRTQLRDVGRDWPSVFELLVRNPHLRMRLAGSEPILTRPLAISPIPYGLLLRHAIAEGLFAIGDQAAVIPSFTGDGLALALHSGRFAAQTLLCGRSSHHFHAELHKQLRYQLRLSTLLSRGLVAEPQRSALALTARLFPSALRAVASHTRLPFEYRITRLPKNSCAPA